MKNIILIISLFLTFPIIAKNKIAQELTRKFLENGDEFSFYIKDNKGNEISQNADKFFIPASIFKIFSSYYILDKLGTDYQFITTLGYRGEIKDSILKGDLILTSSGDPSLLTPKIFDLIESAFQSGIRKVEGRLIINNEFVNLSRIGNVGLDDQPYNQGISGFNLNFNRFKSVGRSDKDIFPIHNGLEIKKADRPLGPGVNFKNIKTKKKETWVYDNSKEYYLEVPIRNTLKFNANYFGSLLRKRGIEFNAIAYEKIAPQKVIGSVKSLSSLELVKLAMEYSNNLFIETLMLKATGEDNLDIAAKKMIKDLKVQVKGEVENSSGLSTKLELTPKEIVSFIQSTAYQKFNNNYFINIFSISGHSGSLARKYLSEKGFEKFRYKTGSLDYVYNICGQSYEKNPRTFCLMINNPKKREILMGKNSAKNEMLRQEAKAWRRSKERFSELVLMKLFN